MFSFSETHGNGPIVEEVSENQVNVATRQVNLSDILGKMNGETRIGPKNVLSL